MSKRLTTIDFIEKCAVIHNNRYDYSKVEYINEKALVSIICLEHGIFNQSASSHYRSGCPSCAIIKRSNSRKTSLDILISKFNNRHNNKYDYSLIKFTTMRNSINIICKKHNIEFTQTPEKHIESKSGGCPKCNSIGKGKSTNTIFIEKSNNLYDYKYDYSLVNYIKSNTKVKIVCKVHGIFEMTPNSHLMGRGCGICNRNGGIMENRWLDTLNIDNKYRQYKVSKFYVDGIDLDKMIIYEFNGDFWHGNPDIYSSDDVNSVNGIKYGELYKRTIERKREIESLGYKVISIWESDFKKISDNYVNR